MAPRNGNRPAGNRIGKMWLEEFQPKNLLSSLMAGVLVGAIATVFLSSYISLIFSGSMARFLPQAIAIGLSSVAFSAFAIALTSSYPGAIANLTASPVLVLSLIAQAWVAGFEGSLPAEQLFKSLVITLALSTAIAGGVFFLLGALGWGGAVRYIPLPVTGGLLAGLGWFLVRGGMKVMTGLPVAWEHFGFFFQPEILVFWAPGILLGAVMVVVQSRIRHFLVLPVFFVGGTMLFYFLAWSGGFSVEELAGQGWLIPPVSGVLGSWHRPLSGEFFAIDFALFGTQAANIGTLVVIATLNILLYLSATELLSRQDIDFNHELKITGLSNLVAGLAGGLFSSFSMVSSNSARRMGAPRRLTGLVMAAFCVLMVVFGGGVIAFIPKVILGAMLVAGGLELMKEWLVVARKRLPVSDYVVVVLIALTMGAVGFLPGVGVGIAAGLILFAVQYARVDVVKTSISGANWQGNVDRPKDAQHHLKQHGDRILILRLQGYIFFGTAVKLEERVRNRLESLEREGLKYLVMDFRAVTGLDSSSINSFIKVNQYAERYDFQILLTHLDSALADQIRHGGLGGPRVHYFSDLQRGVAWGEDHMLLQSNLKPVAEGEVPLVEMLGEVFDDPKTVNDLLPFMERLTLNEGEVLIQQGEPSTDLFFIESGRLRVELKPEGRPAVMVRTLGAGAFVGEVAFYLGLIRSASVLADTSAVVYRLHEQSLQQMARKKPQLASSLHRYFARVLAQRLADTNRLLQDFLE